MKKILWPCFSSGRCTGLECIAFVGQNIVDVLGVSSQAENTAIQGIFWRPDMIALYIYIFIMKSYTRYTIKRKWKRQGNLIYLLHRVNCNFWHNVLYSAPAAFFAIVIHYNLNIYDNNNNNTSSLVSLSVKTVHNYISIVVSISLLFYLLCYLAILATTLINACLFFTLPWR